MEKKHNLKNWFLRPILGFILALLSVFAPVTAVYAEPVDTTTDSHASTPVEFIQQTITEKAEKSTTTTENTATPAPSDNETNDAKNTDDTTNTTEKTEGTEATEEENTCYDQVEGIGWLVCPTTGVFAKIIDAVYEIIEGLLVVEPITSNEGSPVYLVWQYARDITNIVFVIMLLVIIWSQLTGIGVNNYGIKKTLPRLIIAAVLVNFSFIICSLAVDASNIVGTTLRGFFTSIEETAIANGAGVAAGQVSWTGLFGAITGGTAIAGLAIGVTGGLGSFLWMFLGAVIGALLAIFVGLVTIALRQAVVAMLIMISPLAFVAYLLPNTEKWFKKWGETLFSMLIFYPMFSVLFGASQLAGWALIASATNAFWVILGMAVQVMPLFLAVQLMKMSNTALGTVSKALSGITNKIGAGAKSWTGQHAEQRRQNYLANARTPAAGLRRYLDSRYRAREIDIDHSKAIRAGTAEKAAQRFIGGNRNYTATGGYKLDKNGKVVKGIDGKPILADTDGFKTNRYTRNAARANALALEVDAATKDTAHIIGNYSSYHNRTAADRRLAGRVANAYVESTRANFTAINDTEADTDWLVNKYIGYANKGHDTPEYKHFITAAGGALGERGSESVMAQVIEKAAIQEAQHRKRSSILQNKYKYSKGEARSMYVGHYVNDDGIATDKSGKELRFKVENGVYSLDSQGRIEHSPGELLKNAPHLLVAYDQHDEAGDAYFNMVDQQGKFVTRIYKKDSPMVKELLSNFDMPINDPINGYYGILSSVKEGSLADTKFTDAAGTVHDVNLPDVGLAKFSTTVGRGIMSSRFKEKAAFAGPMYSTSVMNQYIKDYVHQNMARLDNLFKTGKSGGFNVQDRAELAQLALLMDPANWKDLFPEDSLRSYVNVNGKPLSGTAIDEDGNFIKGADPIPHDKATYDELFATVRKKWLNPLAPKLAAMMGRYTQNTADNQKPGTDDKWNDLYAALKNYQDPQYRDKYHLDDPFAEQTGFYEISREIKDNIHPPRRRHANNQRSPYSKDNPASSENILYNHELAGDIDTVPNALAQADFLYEQNSFDADSFSDAILEYLQDEEENDPRFGRAFEAFYEYRTANPYASVDDLYSELNDILISIFSD